MCSRVTYNEIHLIEFKEIISIQLQFHSITSYLKYLYYKYLLIYVIQTQLEVQSLALVCWLIQSYIYRTASARKTVLPLITWGTSEGLGCRKPEGRARRILTKTNEQDDFREWLMLWRRNCLAFLDQLIREGPSIEVAIEGNPKWPEETSQGKRWRYRILGKANCKCKSLCVLS